MVPRDIKALNDQTLVGETRWADLRASVMPVINMTSEPWFCAMPTHQRLLLMLLKDKQALYGTRTVLPANPIEEVKNVDVDICVVCHEEKNNLIVTLCGHIYCPTCLQTWLQTKFQCAICKRRLTP